MGSFSFQWGNNNPTQPTVDKSGNWFYSILDSFTKSKGFKNQEQKLNIVLNNPAALKVLSFIADVGSQVEIIQNEDKDFLTKQAKQPNDWQGWADLHWDVNFWRAMGAAYVYVDNNVFYTLVPSRIEFSAKQKKDFGQLTFSKYGENAQRNIKKGRFKYKNENGSTQLLEIKNLHILSDLSNSICGNWLNIPSRIDALYKVVSNSNAALESKGVNLHYTKKFIVSGQNDPKNISKLPMDGDEQKSINELANTKNNLIGVKNPVTATHLVSNISQLKLDDSYISDLTVIANMFGITKDVLAILSKGSTYENYEKAMALYISYTQTPNDIQLTELYERIFDVTDLKPSYAHLSFNSVMEVDKINNQKIELESLKMAQELGMEESEVKNKLKEIYG